MFWLLLINLSMCKCNVLPPWVLSRSNFKHTCSKLHVYWQGNNIYFKHLANKNNKKKNLKQKNPLSSVHLFGWDPSCGWDRKLWLRENNCSEPQGIVCSLQDLCLFPCFRHRRHRWGPQRSWICSPSEQTNNSPRRPPDHHSPTNSKLGSQGNEHGNVRLQLEQGNK